MCVNPAHLFVGTNLENIEDSMRKGRRKGASRNRPSGLKYNLTSEKRAKWIENKRLVSGRDRILIYDLYQILEGVTQRHLALVFGVSQSTINRIIHEYPHIRRF